MSETIQTKQRYLQTEKGKAARKRYNQSKKGKANQRRSYIQYKKRHPEIIAAKVAVERAIATGKIIHFNFLQCSCGKQAKLYHHHKGYAPEHWLDVIPVCRNCHLIAHASA